jgi:hypothetical protein
MRNLAITAILAIAFATVTAAPTYAGEQTSAGGGNAPGAGATAYYGEPQPQIGWTRIHGRVVPLDSVPTDSAAANGVTPETAQR